MAHVPPPCSRSRRQTELTPCVVVLFCSSEFQMSWKKIERSLQTINSFWMLASLRSLEEEEEWELGGRGRTGSRRRREEGGQSSEIYGGEVRDGRLLPRLPTTVSLESRQVSVALQLLSRAPSVQLHLVVTSVVVYSIITAAVFTHSYDKCIGLFCFVFSKYLPLARFLLSYWLFEMFINTSVSKQFQICDIIKKKGAIALKTKYLFVAEATLVSQSDVQQCIILKRNWTFNVALHFYSAFNIYHKNN